MALEPTKPIITLEMVSELNQLVSVAKRRSRELLVLVSTNTNVLIFTQSTANPQLTSKGKKVARRVR